MAFQDFQRVRRLGRYLQKDKKRLLIILFLLLPLSFAGAIQPLLVGQAISVLKGEAAFSWLSALPMQSAIRILITLLLISVLVRLALQGFQSYNIQTVGQSLTARIRKDLFSHAINLSLRYHDSMPVGKLLTRLTSDVDALSEVFGSGAVGVLADVVTLIVISITMLLIDWQLGLLLLTTQVPVTLFILWLQKRYRRSNYRVREELSELNADFQENLQGIEVVQMFRRQGANARRFNQTGIAYRNAVNSIIFYDSSISAFIEWVSLAVVALVIALGGWLVTAGSMGLGTLTAFILYSQRLFEPLRQLAERFTQIQGGLTAVERIGELLEEDIEILDFKGDKENISLKSSKESCLGEVVFENVSFHYRPDDQIISDLSFKISPGEHIALVGPTGSGKTTLIRLLCRLYEPQEGRILIDGVDIKDIPLSDLRKQIGVVLQDTFLFSGNVADNLRLDSSITDERLAQICNDLGLGALLNRFPNGLKTTLRERGSNISSGERQLLSVARVAIRSPKILIMDEATAFMDPSTEATLQRDLDRLLEKRTALVIAHRLATIESSDRILVMKKGKLIEQGNHQDLVSQGGLYAQLAKLQEQGLAKF
jgi:ATP-binding cassette subfamily B protein